MCSIDTEPLPRIKAVNCTRSRSGASSFTSVLAVWFSRVHWLQKLSFPGNVTFLEVSSLMICNIHEKDCFSMVSISKLVKLVTDKIIWIFHWGQFVVDLLHFWSLAVICYRSAWQDDWNQPLWWCYGHPKYWRPYIFSENWRCNRFSLGKATFYRTLVGRIFIKLENCNILLSCTIRCAALHIYIFHLFISGR